MSLQVLYFAGLRESLGLGAEQVDLAALEDPSVGGVRDWLVKERGRTALASAKNLRCALNQEMVRLDARVKPGDEVAFFPPVTGG